MGSHSITCHPTEVTFPLLPQPKLVLDLATPEECKAELTLFDRKANKSVDYNENTRQIVRAFRDAVAALAPRLAFTSSHGSYNIQDSSLNSPNSSERSAARLPACPAGKQSPVLFPHLGRISVSGAALWCRRLRSDTPDEALRWIAGGQFTTSSSVVGRNETSTAQQTLSMDSYLLAPGRCSRLGLT